MIAMWMGKNPIYFGVIRSKVTVTINRIFDNRVVSTRYIVSDLDLWPNDPKIYMFLPLPQGNHVAKFVKDPIYRTKVIVLGHMISLWTGKNPIYFGVIRSKVKVTVTINRIFDNRIVCTHNFCSVYWIFTKLGPL
jgi:hypothetical protein